MIPRLVAAAPGPGRMAAGAVLAATAALAPAARAGEGERAASAGAAFATYATPDADEEEMLRPTGGLALAVTYERGFSDYASWRIHGAGALHAGGGLAGTGLVTVGLSYRVDVLRYVPYVIVGVGGLVRAGGPFTTGIEPALEVGGGVDWLRGRDRSWGVHAAVTGFAADTTTVQIGLRTTWRWGYF